MNIQTFRPEDSERLVKELFDCIDGRDWAGLCEFLHDEAIYERPGYEPFVGRMAITTASQISPRFWRRDKAATWTSGQCS
ncbi:nuclear transport factor 2 family protein, partial [Bradyrhizobium sp. SZCCHNS1054]|uniref:nuclear transport factor 2 family protein n=1 Tax=Bradyrhizobium sp. SZCCHNS1054 TaxID=3057301 RepID=UPI002916A358